MNITTSPSITTTPTTSTTSTTTFAKRVGLSVAVMALMVGASSCAKGMTDASKSTATKSSNGISAAQSAGNPDGIRSINVRGTGTVDATPDNVTVTLGVETTSTSAAQALKDNNTKAAELIKALKDRGVSDKDIQTSSLFINPQYDNTGRRIERYAVNNSVSAKLRDIKNAGSLIDAAASVSGDAIRVNGVQFGVTETGPAKDKARVAAIEDARKQAEQLATAAGVKLGKLRVIQSGTSIVARPFELGREKLAEASVPLEAGSQAIIVEVELAFDLE